MITGVVPSVNAFAYGAYDVSQSTFKTDTDNSADFQNWVSNVWQGGEGAFSGTDQVALTPGSDANDLNFGWYSESKGIPAVMIWKSVRKERLRYLPEQHLISVQQTGRERLIPHPIKYILKIILLKIQNIVISTRMITKRMVPVYGLNNTLIPHSQPISFQLSLPVIRR